ncbi:MAG: PDZ domain-containing protein [Gemmataceae bacterium]
MRRAAILGLLILGSVALSAQEITTRQTDVTVPFELLKSGHMAVSVRVNGKGPYLLIFDTGAPTSLLNSRVAREANLNTSGGSTLLPIFGPFGEAKIKTLEVGNQKAENISCIVMDHPTVELIAQKLGKKIDGIVGFPFFSRFRLTLDYQNRTMTLQPSGYKPQDVMAAMTSVMISGAGKKTLTSAAQWGIQVAKDADDEKDGINIRSVVRGSAAEKAGLKPGDRLLTLDGRWIDTIEDLYEAAVHVKPGRTTPVTFERGGQTQKIMVTPEAGL